MTQTPCAWVPTHLHHSAADIAWWNALPAAMRTYCDGVGAATLWAATGRRFDACTIISRPIIGRRHNTVLDAIRGDYGYFGVMDPDIPGIEYPVDQFDMECDPTVAILDSPVQSITSVTVDGAVIAPAKYRVDDGCKLTRIDGDTWPLWQETSLPATATGTFVVTYVVGFPIPAVLLAAAGSYALETARALHPGTTCRLPSMATSIVREGVTIERVSPETLLANNLTGLPDVDAVIKAYNPRGETCPAGVYAPGRRSVRTSA